MRKLVYLPWLLAAIILAAYLLITGGSAFAAGKTEGVKMSILASDWAIALRDGKTQGEMFKAEAARMGITLETLKEDISTGGTLSIDALMAAGRSPTIYWAFNGRVAKVIRADWALPLDRYKDRFVESYLAPLYRDGKLLAAPMDINNQGMMVNLDMFDEIGFAMPENWSVDDFLRMCALAKAKGKYGTALFAKSQSADYLYMNWFASFGADMFKQGDYSKVTINSAAGVKTARFFRLLYASRYVPAESPQLVDDDALAMFWNGKCAAFANYAGWEGNMQAAIESKQLAKPFRYRLVRFPAAAGVSKVPASWQGGLAAVDKKQDSLVLHRFLDWFLSPAMANKIIDVDGSVSMYKCLKGVMPNLGVSIVQSAALEIARVNGLWDQGATIPQFPNLRKCWFPIFADLMVGKVTAERAMAEYEAALNKVLAE